jgi:membrane protease YdiL (CAAX protease family)
MLNLQTKFTKKGPLIMTNTTSESETTTFMKFIAFFLIAIGCSLIGGMLAAGIVGLLFGIPINELTNISEISSSNKVQAARLTQFFASIVTFILPTWLYLKFVLKQPFNTYLNLKSLSSYKALMFLPLIIITVNPFIYKSTEWTRMLGISKIMEANTVQMNKVIEAFLSLEGIPNIAFNLFVMAIMAGITEEILFRGVIQKGLKRFFKNPHLAIWSAALIFSVIHMEFEGSIARMGLGGVFGYLYFYSKNLWYPIIAHALHNGITIIVAIMYENDMIDIDLNTTESIEVNWATFLLFTSIAISLIILFKKQFNQTELEHE